MPFDATVANKHCLLVNYVSLTAIVKLMMQSIDSALVLADGVCMS